MSITESRISGAGVIILEKYKGINTITLFGKKNIRYEDPGGLVDTGEKTYETASRECREESANLINISSDDLKMLSGEPVLVGSYMVYIIYIE